MASNFERRAKLTSGGTAARLPWQIRLGRTQATRLVIAGFALAAAGDVLTGDSLWFGPVYLLLIAIAAWSLGWREAIFTGCASLAVGLSTNGLALYPYGGLAAAWNVAVRVLVVLATIAALRNLRSAYESEWRLARTDLLTGALNRKGFFELTFGIQESRDWTLLAYADLDGLKKLNDQQGHRAGDESLHMFSRQVLMMIRKDDIFARLGGDEFAIYMRVKDEESAKIVAARLHAGMQSVEAEHSLGCSLGALIVQPGPRAIDPELCAADDLMYKAKGLGASLIAATATHDEDEVRIIRHHGQLTPRAASQKSRPVFDGAMKAA